MRWCRTAERLHSSSIARYHPVSMQQNPHAKSSAVHVHLKAGARLFLHVALFAATL